MAKKLILSIGVVLTFIAYSIQQRGDTTIAVIKPSSAPAAVSQSTSSTVAGQQQPAAASSSAGYKNGIYTGTVADAYYGYVQVQATISGGRITDVEFLQYPSDQENSRYINSQAMPYLKQEAIAAQSSRVDTITGATDTSMAFIQSLASALAQAQT